MWLNPRAGKMKRILHYDWLNPVWDFSALVPQLKVPFLGIIQPNKLGHCCICTDGGSADVLRCSF